MEKTKSIKMEVKMMTKNFLMGLLATVIAVLDQWLRLIPVLINIPMASTALAAVVFGGLRPDLPFWFVFPLSLAVSILVTLGLVIILAFTWSPTFVYREKIDGEPVELHEQPA